MIKAALALVAVVLGLIASVHTVPPLTRHDAKVRTFKALLHVTELAPDVTDASHAAVTVAGCRRVTNGFRCVGSLAPVAMSGIPGLTCVYIVNVYKHSTRMNDGDCS